MSDVKRAHRELVSLIGDDVIEDNTSLNAAILLGAPQNNPHKKDRSLSPVRFFKSRSFFDGHTRGDKNTQRTPTGTVSRRD
jgi:hypothetical protein